MTPQLRYVAMGGSILLASRYGFGKDWHTALTWGLASIAFAAILTASDKEPA